MDGFPLLVEIEEKIPSRIFDMCSLVADTQATRLSGTKSSFQGILHFLCDESLRLLTDDPQYFIIGTPVLTSGAYRIKFSFDFDAFHRELTTAASNRSF